MGLYDEDDAAVTSGELNSQEYWAARALSRALDQAVQSRQPQAPVGRLLEDAVRVYRAALATYPNHAELLAWRRRAEELQAKLDPAARSEPFRPDFSWGSDRFRQGWAALQHARFARQEQDWKTAFEQARAVDGRWYECRRDAKKWPETERALFEDGQAEAKAIFAEAQKKR